MSEKPSWLMTNNQILKMYQTYPGQLAEDLDLILGISRTQDDMAVHNHIVKKLQRLCPDRNKMLIAVARAIINTIKE